MDYDSPLDDQYDHPPQQNDTSTQVSDAPRGMFDWMSTHSRVPPEMLPRAPHSLVFEGFIPDAYPEVANPATIRDGIWPELEPQRLPILHRPTRLEDDAGDSPQSTGYQDETDEHVLNSSPSFHPPVADEFETGQEDLMANTKRKRGRKPGSSYTKPRKKRGEGRRGGWSKGIKVGPRPHLEASEEFNRLHTEAVGCLVGENPNPQRALELITKAIAMNPEQHRAHPVLAEVHHQLGNDEAAIDVLFVGAHANPRDPVAWQDVADRCFNYVGEGRGAALDKALIACSELLNIDKNNQEARFRRACIHRELGKPIKCINELEKILAIHPHNSSAMEEYAKACIDLQRVPKALDLYKAAIEHYMEVGLDEEETFEWSDVGIYTDLVVRNGEPQDTIPAAIKALKKLSRWLQKREKETYWEDECINDDREFDMADEPRRILVPQYMPGRRLPEAYGLGLPIELRTQLGILRLRYGDRVEALGHFEWLIEEGSEAEQQEYVHEVPDLFLQVAKALANTKEHAEALRFFEALQEAGKTDTHDFWAGIGHSSYVCDKKEQALECFQKALICDGESIDARTWIAKLLIEKGEMLQAVEYARDAVETAQARIPQKPDTRVYEKRGARLLREEAERTLRLAHKLIGPKIKRKYRKRKRPELELESNGAIQTEKSEDESLADNGDLHTNPTEEPEELTVKEVSKSKSNKRTRSLKTTTLPDEDEAYRYERILQYYTTLLNNTDAMRSGDIVARGIWIDCAKALIDDLRSNKILCNKERHKGVSGPDAEWIKAIDQSQTPSRYGSTTPSQLNTQADSLPMTYRSIPVTSWLDVLLEYALLHTVDPYISRKTSYDAISVALACALFSHSADYTFQIQLCHLLCALSFRDQRTLFNNVLRWFIREHAFCSDAYRLFGAMNLYFPYFTTAGPASSGPGGQGWELEGSKDTVMHRAVWRNANTQKFLRRHVYGVDKALVDGYACPSEGQVPAFMRRDRDETLQGFTTQTDIDPVTGELVKRKVVLRTEEMDVVLLVLYGQLLYATGSFVSALSYFYRARAIDPANPLVLLSIALSYMHQMFKRNEVNKHGLVLQGWAMFGEYEDKRMAWAREKEKTGEFGVIEEVRCEIIFNRARCWEMLGCAGLARKEFEKLLSEDEDGADNKMDLDLHANGEGGEATDQINDNRKGNWTMEAAYAISNMYMLGGDKETARMITEKYLVIE